MYMIKNIGKHDIGLGDLHVVVPPGRAVDLDAIAERHTIEGSPSLRLAVKKGLIRIVRKDGVEYLNSDKSREELLSEMKEMEKRLTEKLNAQVAKHIPEQTVQPAVDLSGLNAVVEQLQKLANQAATGTAQPAQAQQNSEISEVPEDKMVDIHRRAVSRMTKDVQANIKHEESKSKSDVTKNLDELEGML